MPRSMTIPKYYNNTTTLSTLTWDTRGSVSQPHTKISGTDVMMWITHQAPAAAALCPNETAVFITIKFGFETTHTPATNMRCCCCCAQPPKLGQLRHLFGAERDMVNALANLQLDPGNELTGVHKLAHQALLLR